MPKQQYSVVYSMPKPGNRNDKQILRRQYRYDPQEMKAALPRKTPLALFETQGRSQLADIIVFKS
jgi:hypothetical protein